MEGAARQRALVKLFLRGGHDLGMAVAEVVGRVGGKHVVVFPAFGIGHDGAFGLHDDDGLRRIVVGAVLVGLLNDLF